METLQEVIICSSALGQRGESRGINSMQIFTVLRGSESNYWQEVTPIGVTSCQ